MQKANTIKVLFCFYHWLVVKGYTEYRLYEDEGYD